jgi:ornithine--oxo-acid transaminase
VAIAALDVLEQEELAERSRELGEYFAGRLRTIQHPDLKEVRGRGLFIGMELNVPARPYCERLMKLGILCKETHEHTIRFAPPLIIRKSELDQAFECVRQAFQDTTP